MKNLEKIGFREERKGFQEHTGVQIELMKVPRLYELYSGYLMCVYAYTYEIFVETNEEYMYYIYANNNK